MSGTSQDTRLRIGKRNSSCRFEWMTLSFLAFQIPYATWIFDTTLWTLSLISLLRSSVARRLLRSASHGDQTWVAAFSLLTQNLLDSEYLPPEAPLDYASLCDWLTENLEARLASTSLVNPRLIEDARNGETFGLRVAFEWGPARGPMEFGDLWWWELMEVLPYEEVYDSTSNNESGG